MANNTNPNKIDDRQLLAYLDGEADKETAGRIEASEEYLQRARELAQMEKRLKAQLFRVDCPEAMELGEYHLGLLNRKRSKVIKQHIKECPHCARELDQLRAFLQEGMPQEKETLLNGVKVLIARLLGETQQSSTQGGLALSPAYISLRGESRGPMTLEADGVLIMLDFQPTEDRKVNILCQLAADDQVKWTGANIELRRGGMILLKSKLDDLGAFRGEGLDPGLIELTITSSEGTIILANFEIRDE